MHLIKFVSPNENWSNLIYFCCKLSLYVIKIVIFVIFGSVIGLLLIGSTDYTNTNWFCKMFLAKPLDCMLFVLKGTMLFMLFCTDRLNNKWSTYFKVDSVNGFFNVSPGNIVLKCHWYVQVINICPDALCRVGCFQNGSWYISQTIEFDGKFLYI